jgi:sulfur relay (sulfurtransferase) DsrC/TusE family protein
MAHPLIHLIEDKIFEMWFDADKKIDRKYEIFLKNERDWTQEYIKQIAAEKHAITSELFEMNFWEALKFLK